MNTDLITAALLAPGALVGVPLLLASHRQTRHDKAVLAMLAQERANRATTPATEDALPPEGGQPTPVPADTAAGTDDLAQVIPFPARRAA